MIITSSTQPRAKRACVSIVLYRDIHGQNKGEEVRVNVRVKTMVNAGGTYGGVVRVSGEYVCVRNPGQLSAS